MQQRLYRVNLIQEAPFCSDLYFKMLRISNAFSIILMSFRNISDIEWLSMEKVTDDVI